MLISIVIPVFNEEQNIPILYNRVNDVISNLSENRFEFLFINDGSTDNSITEIKKLSEKDCNVRYIDFSRNFGHQIALSAGLDHANGDVVIIMDSDLQDPPELIIDMLKKYSEGFHVVYTQSIRKEGETFLKKITSKMFYRMLSTITSTRIPIDVGDYRLIDKKIVEVLRNMPERHKFLRGQIAWIGFNQTCITFKRERRYSGSTGYTYRKMFRLAMDGITAFSDFPLRLASIMGFLVSIVAFFIMIYALWSKFILNNVVPGWTSLIMSVMFIGGIQLMCLGLLGEYIGRMGDNIKNRPLYIIKDSNG